MSRITLSELLERMIQRKASDLHLDTYAPPSFRVNGDIVKTPFSPFTEDQMIEELDPYLTEENKEVFSQKGDVDFAISVKGVGRFRVNLYSFQRGMGAAFRHINTKISNLDELELPPILKKIANYRRGLVIITGPTGSGKSTTLAAIIKEINQTRPAHILTIEDPVEYVHENIKCLITHREIGRDAVSFSDALVAAVREDPDIILVGEMRDLITVRLAIRAAGMGFLVFTTLHTNSASKVVDRILNIFPPEEQDEIRTNLSEAFRAAIAQQLLKRADGSGRVAALEILLATSGLGNLIREKKTFQIPFVIITGREQGMQNMDRAMIDLYKQRKIDLPTLKAKINDYSALQLEGIL